jgi:hypothetical protein
MDERAFLGPIDPQVLSKDGRWVPAQALITLLDKIQRDGEALSERAEIPNVDEAQLDWPDGDAAGPSRSRDVSPAP